MPTVQCVVCGTEFKRPARDLGTARFCSHTCYGKWRSENLKGKNNPHYKGGMLTKTCQHCGSEFNVIQARSEQKFCSKLCADKGGFRYSGESHPNYSKDSRRKNRSGHHHKWANAVISRDGAKCQHCGATEVQLHAHHIKSYKDYPELRYEVSNGLTLCYECHWAVHTALTAKAVNSGNIPPGNAEDNPEPSIDGNVFEGVTTRGRAYRRWVGACKNCGKTISKSLSDTKGKANLFCSHSCSSKYYKNLPRQ